MRIRLRYTKLGKVRFLGHRDLARVWERAWRKARLPITYTEGFSPRPKMHFGLALSTGYESLGEYLDVDVPDDAAVDVDGLAATLSPLLPEGVDVQVATVVPPGTRSLQDAVTSCRWLVEVDGIEPAALVEAVRSLVEADVVEIERERKGKVTVDDVRPYLLHLVVVGPTVRGHQLEAELGTRPRGLRPAEVVTALASTSEHSSAATLVGALRTHQWTMPDGARQEPLSLPATWASRAEARAS